MKMAYAAVLLWLAGVGPILLGATFYRATNLGTLGWSSVTPYGINAAGQVTGMALNADGKERAFLYSSGVMLDLGTLLDTPTAWSYGFGINDAGQVTGTADGHAFLYSAGTMIDLGTLRGDNAVSEGLAINASGQVTGFSDSLDDWKFHAFLYSEGFMNDLGSIGDISSEGLGINASGQVTGRYTDSQLGTRAFLYTDGTMRDLGMPAGSSSLGRAINDHGQVTGYLTVDGHSHAFLYTGGRVIDLGTLGGNYSFGWAINNAGVVVGSSTSASSVDSFAFVYSDGAMWDLNTLIKPSLGVTLQNATGINDAGQIVAGSYLLTPYSSEPRVPEPATSSLIAAGILAVSLASRRRRLRNPDRTSYPCNRRIVLR
jgi:probable HAF family extracellular repeat protein